MSNPLPSPEVERCDSQPDTAPGIVNWPLPESVPAHDLKTLGDAVRASQQNWSKTVNPGGGA